MDFSIIKKYDIQTKNDSVHGFMQETSDFSYSIITFSYTKYFVYSYTVDVVFILS